MSNWPNAREEACPNRAKHTRDRTEPDGYIGWHEWAERKSKTHVQERCPGCGLFVIWKRKKRVPA